MYNQTMSTPDWRLFRLKNRYNPFGEWAAANEHAAYELGERVEMAITNENRLRGKDAIAARVRLAHAKQVIYR